MEEAVNKEVVPVIGMKVEVSEAGVTEGCTVCEVNEASETFSLNDRYGHRYVNNCKNYELVSVGGKVIWNHD